MPNITRQIKECTRIDQVWCALGGGKLLRNRGQAFWRNGDGYSISLDIRRGLWYDFTSNIGGDAFALVQTALGCGFRDALAWLANFTGAPVPGDQPRRDVDTDWPGDLRAATMWRMAAKILTEMALEELPHCHSDRRALTILLETIQSGDAALVAEYRQWRRIQPTFTAAMVHAGRLHDARIQRKAARWLVNYCG